MTIWAILDSHRHFIPQDKLTLILFTNKTSSDPLLVEQVKEVIVFFLYHLNMYEMNICERHVLNSGFCS